MPTTTHRPRAARVLLAVSALVFGGAVIGLAAEVAWVASWFYTLSWWSYVLAVDALVHLRRGESPFLSRPRAALLLSLWSASFWLFYEAANFRLQNWYYVGVPKDWFARGPGVVLSFATVLPGVLGTYQLLAAFGFAGRARSRPFRLSPVALALLRIAGLACLVLPLAFPRACYPLIWGATALLAEPWLASHGERGLLSRLAAGDPRPVLQLLAAGLACGLLWETLNADAHAKWIYTVPYFEETKLFEMPLAGFLGFPPFALECYAFARALVALGLLPEWELGLPARERRPRRELAGAALALAASVPAVVGVNLWTLRATRPEVDEVAGIDAGAAARLRERGIATADELLRARERGALGELERELGPERLARALEHARLMDLRGLGAPGARWLEAAGVASVDELARADERDLLARLDAARPSVELPPPRPAEVRVWLRAAREQAER